MTTTPEELLPCPFCGGKAKIDITLPECAVEEVWMVWCCCALEGYATKEQATKAWNTRVYKLNE